MAEISRDDLEAQAAHLERAAAMLRGNVLIR